MSSQVLARKYRPQTFEEVVGQRAVIQTLQNAIKSGRIAQAYLFTGTRGVGKTTVARILAKALNCVNGPTATPCGVCEFCKAIQEDRLVDVLEIDGASNTGIDNIRDLRDLVQYKAMHSRYKIIIIDEVHQISKPAFNALLKTLEEPPEKTVFIFATTEFQKVPPTIVSRCQYFEFKNVSLKDLIAHLVEVAGKENLTLTENGFAVLARAADGSIRDSLTLLDQAAAFCGSTISDEDLDLILGTINRDLMFEFSSAVLAGAADRIFPLTEKVIDSGYDLRTFHKRLIEHFRDLLIVRTVSKPGDILHLSEADLAPFRTEAGKTGEEDLLRYLQALQDGEPAMKYSLNPQIAFETLLVKLCHFNKLVDLKDILAGLDEPAAKSGPVSDPRSRPAYSGNSSSSPAPSYGSRPSYSSSPRTTPPARPPMSPAATASVAARAVRSGIGRDETKTSFPSAPAPTPASPAAPPAASNGNRVSPDMRAAQEEKLAGREAALQDPRVKKVQDKLKGRVVSVEDPKPWRSDDEEK